MYAARIKFMQDLPGHIMCDHERGKKVNVIHQVMAYHLSKTSFVYFGFFSCHLDTRSLAQLPATIHTSVLSRTPCPWGILCCYSVKNVFYVKKNSKNPREKNPSRWIKQMRDKMTFDWKVGEMHLHFSLWLRIWSKNARKLKSHPTHNFLAAMPREISMS